MSFSSSRTTTYSESTSESSSFSSSKDGGGDGVVRIRVVKTIQRTLPDGTVFTETVTDHREEEGRARDFRGDHEKVAHTTTRRIPVENLRRKSARDLLNASNSSSDDDEEVSKRFAQEALEAHNKVRERHQVQPLVLDDKLCTYAQSWADRLARDDRFDHRSDCPHGENLFCMWSSNKNIKVPGNAPVDSWYSEGSKYSYGSQGCMSCGHFTQVVWRDSKQLGIAKARSPRTGKVIVVANYSPAGNIIGRYGDNVLPPKN